MHEGEGAEGSEGHGGRFTQSPEALPSGNSRRGGRRLLGDADGAGDGQRGAVGEWLEVVVRPLASRRPFLIFLIKILATENGNQKKLQSMVCIP